MTHSPRRGGRSAALVAGLVVLGVLVALRIYLTRSGEVPDASARDGLTYEQRVAPLVEEAGRLCGRIATNAPLEAVWNDTRELAGRWAQVRTAAGYDRFRHDQFIIEFSRIVLTLQSGELVWTAWKRLADDAATVPEAERTALMFALQGIHGNETAAQLIGGRGLPIEVLLSRTNLAAEVQTSLRNACGFADRAATAYSKLPPPAP